MDEPATESEALRLLRRAEDALTAAALDLDALALLRREGLQEAAELAGRVKRLSDAMMVQVVHHVEHQCRADPAESLAAAHGLRDAMTLLMTITGASRYTLNKYRRLAAVTTVRAVGSTGALPPSMPALPTPRPRRAPVQDLRCPKEPSCR